MINRVFHQANDPLSGTHRESINSAGGFSSSQDPGTWGYVVSHIAELLLDVLVRRANCRIQASITHRPREAFTSAASSSHVLPSHLSRVLSSVADDVRPQHLRERRHLHVSVGRRVLLLVPGGLRGIEVSNGDVM